MESILPYKLKSTFFPDIQFSQNHIANHEASFKAWKVMLSSLKYQIFCFWSKFASFTQLSRQQTQFSKLWICHFLVYMAKCPHAKNWKNPLSRSWGKYITDRRIDRQMGRWRDWFYRTPTTKLEVQFLEVGCFSEIHE